MKLSVLTFAWIGMLLLSNASQARIIGFNGYLGVSYQYFSDDPQYPFQLNNNNPEIIFEPKIEKRLTQNTFFKFKGFYRGGSKDNYRNHTDVRALYWQYTGDIFDVSIGIEKVFWGVTESRHLVDIINQTDIIEGIDEDQKLGQPMLNVNVTEDWGTFSLYWLPYFRKRELPGPESRFITDPPVNTNDVRYSDGENNKSRDAAIRYSKSIGDFDIGLSIFHGYNRQPWLFPSTNGQSLIAYYSPMTQLGIDLQYTNEAWLWKFEGVVNNNHYDNYAAVVAGFEYTYYQIFGSQNDFGVLLEYLRSDKMVPTEDLYNHDIFIGGRWVLNNTADTSFLAGTITDVKTQESLVKLVLKSRVGQSFTMKLKSFLFVHANNSLRSYNKDDVIELSLKYNF